MRAIRLLTSILLILTFSQNQECQTTETKIDVSVNNLVSKKGIARKVEDVMDEMGLKGLSVAVIEDYKIAWTRCWGIKDVESGERINKSTAFSTASLPFMGRIKN